MREETIQIRVSEELKAELKSYCKEKGMTMSEVVRFALMSLFLRSSDSEISDEEMKFVNKVIQKMKQEGYIVISEK